MTASTISSPVVSGTRDAVETSPVERVPWLLAFACLLIPMLPSKSVPLGPLKSYGSPARVLGVLLFGLAILGFLLLRRHAQSPTIYPGVVVLATYFLMQLFVFGAGSVHWDNYAVEASKPRAMYVIVGYVGLGLYACVRARTDRVRAILLGCIAVGLTFNCVVGLLQTTAHVELQYLFEPPGFDHSETEMALAADNGERFGAERATGTSQHAIEYSVLAAITIPLTLHFARFAKTRQTRMLAACACVIAMLAVPAGVSRSGVVALAVALLVYMFAFKVRTLAIGALAISSVVGIQFLISARAIQALLSTIVNSAGDTSISERIADYAKVSVIFHEHPMLGLGIGGVQNAKFNGALDNEWLRALVEGGLVSLAATVILFVSVAFGVNAALKRADTPMKRDRAWALGAMLAGIMSSSYTFDLFAFQQISMLFFLLFGIIWSISVVNVSMSA